MASKVHRVRYYNPKPQPINCASLNKTTKQLAIARGDASIEIWDVGFAPYLLKFIPRIENGSVEALCWIKERLISTGLSGALLEWDLDKLVIKTTTMLTGYAAWCLDVNLDNTLVAAGTEQGYINLFNVQNNDIVYQKLFDKQEGRILCCKFDTTGKLLATGSINTIRVWNVEKGQAISRMSVMRRGKEVIVWCLAFLSDSTLVTGDSAGRLTFWDSQMGDQIESFTTHKADITSLAVSDDEKNLYCSGVDPVILHFTKVAYTSDGSSNSKLQWVKSVQRNIHEHDVRVLVTMGNKELISVGIDGYLTFSSYPPKWIMRIPPMLPPPRSAVCAKKKLLLLRYDNHLEVWKLGSYDTNEVADKNTHTPNGDAKNQTISNSNSVEQDSTDVLYQHEDKNCQNVKLKITEKPVKLISVQTKKNKQMHCCELSPSGEFIFYSTSTDIRMLKLEIEDDQSNILVSKLTVSGVPAACHLAAFSEDSRLLAVHTCAYIHILQCDPDVGATVLHSIALEKYLKSKSLLHLTMSKVSPKGVTYLVAADTKSGVVVFTLKGKKFEPYAILPTYQCVPSALTVDSEKELLYIVYVDQTIIEYELPSKKFAAWPMTVLPASWQQRTAAIHSIYPHPARNAVIFQDQSSFWVVEKELTPNKTQKKFKSKKKRQTDDTENMHLSFKIIPVKYLAGFHWLAKDEAVTIELLPENILAQLPPIVAQKRH